jgi:hypothetical protein
VPDGTPCNSDTSGPLGRYPVTASGFHLIGKETERGWEQSEDVSTLLPSLLRYQRSCVAGEQLKQRLLRIPLDVLERETGLSRHTILRACRGHQVHPRSLERLSGWPPEQFPLSNDEQASHTQPQPHLSSNCQLSPSAQFPLKFTFAPESARVSVQNALTFWSRHALASVASASETPFPLSF